jgi:N6-L-threonylcarbamoyladenine synthase
MTYEDIPAVCEIEKRVFPQPWSADMFASEVASFPRSVYFVAREKGSVVGYAGMYVVADEGHITNLAVAPESQRKGIGTALICQLFETSFEKGVSHLILEVRKSNEEARRLYERFGFEEVGIRRRYYEDNNEDAILLCTPQIRIPYFRSKLNQLKELCSQRDIELYSSEKIFLAIETTCDETAIAVVSDGSKVLASLISSQVDLHRKYGGVVPELAARKHLEVVNALLEETLNEAKLELKDMTAIAVSIGPGLVGALLVGLAAGKTLAWVLNVPLIGVNHLEGHIFANFMEHSELEAPFVSLIVSGGHTMLVYASEWGEYELLGETLDDAAGEAFDKIAGFLNLGYPGGPVIDALARQGNPRAVNFPRALIGRPDYNFSLSGLKTAVINYVSRLRSEGMDVPVADIAASFQEAVIEVQVNKTLRAAKQMGAEKILLAGGVASNSALRERFLDKAGREAIKVYYPSPALCTDNAAMIGGVAYFHWLREDFLSLDAEVQPNLRLGR